MPDPLYREMNALFEPGLAEGRDEGKLETLGPRRIEVSWSGPVAWAEICEKPGAPGLFVF